MATLARVAGLAGLLASPLVAGPAHAHPDPGLWAALPAPAAPTGPAPVRFVAGTAGSGDPYFPEAGNSGYQVRHYTLTLSYDPGTGRLTGTALIRAVATDNLASFDLDLRPALTVRSVQVDGLPASVRRQGQEMRITPRLRPRSGWPFTVTVDYAGTPTPVRDPDGSEEGWLRTDDGAFVVGEPQGASTWFPSSDDPADKATFTVSMTVPDGTTAVGNGRLARRTVRSGRTTFVWQTDHPMATYLATITLGRFTVSRYQTPSGVPIYLAVDPREAEQARPALSRLGDIVDYEQSLFGRYPFQTVGAIVDEAHFVGYALETQTKPVFDRAPSTVLLAHELAHQWFGDSVTPRRWSDIWLNEGFATYAEWLWSEHDGGPTAGELYAHAEAVAAADPGFWDRPLVDPGPTHLFDPAVYLRGAMTLHALRHRVGDGTFFRILRDWASEYRYGTGTTARFVALAERDAGTDLTALFDHWLFHPGRPVAR